MIIICLSALIAFSGVKAHSKFPDGVYVSEGEDYIKFRETGGEVLISSDRIDASEGKCITSWNDKGHTLSWSIFIKKKGLYKIAIRYCQNRSGNSYRKLFINGILQDKSFEKIALPPTLGWSKTENNWNNLIINYETGDPVEVNFSWGVHIFTFENLGGDGQDGAAYIDLIAVLPTDADPNVLGKSGFKSLM
jgi:hypothetical protein